MRKIARYVSVIGVVALAVGLLLSMIPSVSSSVPDLLVILGVVFLVAWPLSSLLTLKRSQARVFFGSATLGMGMLLVLVILVLLNVLGARYTLRWDVTRSGRFSLSQQTKRVLASLPEKVQVLAFFPEGEGQDARDLLTEYAASSRRFFFQFTDPDRHPEKALEYKIRDYGAMVFTMGTRHERVTSATENDFTSALARLMSEETTWVRFLTGHGERRVEEEDKEGLSQLAALLQDEGYRTEETLLLRDGLPSVSDVLLIAGATTPLLPTEMDSLLAFVRRGGNLFVCLEPHPGPGLEGLLRPWGVEPRSDVILDASGIGSLFGMSEVVPLVAHYEENHAITQHFSAATFFPLCRSLSLADSLPQGIEATCIATTSEASWGETGSLDAPEISFEPGMDTEGPLCVLAAISWDRSDLGDTSSAIPGRMVVAGDIDFASNGFLRISANGDLFMNCLSWLAQREELIGIRPKEVRGGAMMLSAQAARSIFYLVVLVMPGAVLLPGLIVWLRRR